MERIRSSNCGKGNQGVGNAFWTRIFRCCSSQKKSQDEHVASRHKPVRACLDARAIEVLATGLPLHHGAQLTVVITLRMHPIQMVLSPTVARRDKELGPRRYFTPCRENESVEPKWALPASLCCTAARSRCRVSNCHRVERRPHTWAHFVLKFLEQKIDEQRVLLERIPQVLDTQSAWPLLSFSAAARANFFLRKLTQTSQTSSAASHDDGVWQCLCRVLKIQSHLRCLGAIFTSIVERRFGFAQCSPDTARSPLGKLGGRVEDGVRAHERRFGEGGQGLTPSQTVLRSTFWEGVRVRTIESRSTVWVEVRKKKMTPSQTVERGSTVREL